MIDVAIRDELVHIRCLLERLVRAVERRTPGPAGPQLVLFGLDAEPEAERARRAPAIEERTPYPAQRHR